MCENKTLDRSKIYLLSSLATIDTILHFSQYKIHNNVLFLNKKTILVWNNKHCSFFICKTLEETPIHIFYDRIHVKSLWEKLQAKFQNDIILPSLTPQTAILGLTNKANNTYSLLASISLIFMYYVYRSRVNHTFDINILIGNLMQIKKKKTIKLC